MNRITLSGNLGHGAQSRTTNNGGMVTFSMAVSERRKNEQGQWETTRTDWFDCVIYTREASSAERIAGHLTNGTRLLLSGKMQSREYEKDGQKRTAWQVRVEEFEILSSKESKERNDDPFASR